jgi:hypothetical protein
MVRSQHVSNVTSKTLKPIIAAQVHKASYIMTDDSRACIRRSRRISQATAPSTIAPKNMSALSFGTRTASKTISRS